MSVIQNFFSSDTDVNVNVTHNSVNKFSSDTDVIVNTTHNITNILSSDTEVHVNVIHNTVNVLSSDTEVHVISVHHLANDLSSNTEVCIQAFYTVANLSSNTEFIISGEYKPITVSLGKVPFYAIIDLSFGTKVLKIELGQPKTIKKDIEIELPNVSFDFLWQTKEWFKVKVTNINKLREVFTVLKLRIHCSGSPTGVKLTHDPVGIMEFEDLSDGTAVIEVNLLEAPEKTIYAKQVVSGASIENWKVTRIEVIAGSKGYPSDVTFAVTIHKRTISMTAHTEEEPWWYDVLVGFTIGSVLTVGSLALKAGAGGLAVSPYTIVAGAVGGAWIVSIIYGMLQYRVRWHIALPVAFLTLYFFTKILG